MSSVEQLARRLADAQRDSDRGVAVGISGFGGSGKSSLANALASMLDGAVRVRGDDFLDPVRSHTRSSDWDGVDRLRLAQEVLVPFREGRPSTYRPFDWSSRSLGNPRPLPEGSVLFVDLIGLFHPDVEDALDVTIWCDLDLATATSWGKARDARLGRDHSRLWDEVWVPNERDFVQRFKPQERADIRVRPLPLAAFAPD